MYLVMVSFANEYQEVFLPKPMPFSIGGVMKAMTKLLDNRLVIGFCALSTCTYFIQFALALIDVPVT